MRYIEERLRELEAYRPELTRRPDFGEFWENTLAESQARELRPKAEQVDYPCGHARVYDISYDGFDGTRIHGWFLVPAFGKAGRWPCLIQYHGFTDSRGLPWQLMHWVMAGMAVLAVDCRAQGGVTGNRAHYTDSGMVSNVTTLGILDPYEYYYRAVYMDCVRAVDFAEGRPEVDPGRIAVRGTSQGGALGMAVCALDGRPGFGIVNVPSNSDMETRIAGRHGSFSAAADFLMRYPDQTDRVLETLSYFDTMNMADRIRCPIFASVALGDEVCPAKCYYASYNRITAPKEITVYPFNGHDGAGDVHMERELRYLRESGFLA